LGNSIEAGGKTLKDHANKCLYLFNVNNILKFASISFNQVLINN